MEYGHGFPTPQDQTLHSPPVRAGDPSLGAAASNRGARSGGQKVLGMLKASKKNKKKTQKKESAHASTTCASTRKHTHTHTHSPRNTKGKGGKAGGGNSSTYPNLAVAKGPKKKNMHARVHTHIHTQRGGPQGREGRTGTKGGAGAESHKHLARAKGPQKDTYMITHTHTQHTRAHTHRGRGREKRQAPRDDNAGERRGEAMAKTPRRHGGRPNPPQEQTAPARAHARGPP